MDEDKIDNLAKVLSKQIDKDLFQKKYVPVKEVLKLVGLGAFLVASVAIPNLPLALKPLIDQKKKDEYEAWKRFNIPYIKRTLKRLEEQELVEVSEEGGLQIVKITRRGRKKVLKMAIDELVLSKPGVWDGKWRVVSFDLPEELAKERKILVEYFKNWKFYPLHKSVYLHAYPCFQEVDFLREYLGISKYVKVFIAKEIEDKQIFKDFFGV